MKKRLFILAAIAMSTSFLLPAARAQVIPLEEDKDKVTVTGTVVNPKGSPLAGKQLCFLVVDKGNSAHLMNITPDGRLEVLTRRTNAQGVFSVRVSRYEKLAIALCRVDSKLAGTEGLEVKEKKELTSLSTTDESKKRFALGKITAE